MDRRALVDGDILLYEIGYSGEILDEDLGETVPLVFDRVAWLLDEKINTIVKETQSDSCQLFLTGRPDIWNNKRMWGSSEDFVPNYREEIAVTKPYKGTRPAGKPFHFYNLIAYMLSEYDCWVTNGIEADDRLSIEQRKDPLHTIICSRDKDLKQVPGWHYSWECGAQKAIGPIKTDKNGWLEWDEEKDKLTGYGDAFLYAQMIMGDVVDNIPGLPRQGPAKAWKLWQAAEEDVDKFFRLVLELYDVVCESKDINPKKYYDEQWNLLKLLEND